MRFRNLLGAIALCVLSVTANASKFTRASQQLVYDSQSLNQVVQQNPRISYQAKNDVSYFINVTQQLDYCMNSQFPPQGNSCMGDFNQVVNYYNSFEQELYYSRDQRIINTLYRVRNDMAQVQNEIQNGPSQPPPHGNGYLSANPNPCYAQGQSLCTTYLQWDTGSNFGAVVTVQQSDSAEEKIYACNDHGTGTAPWISPGKSYYFRLYAISQCDINFVHGRQPVAGITVSGMP